MRENSQSGSEGFGGRGVETNRRSLPLYLLVSAGRTKLLVRNASRLPDSGSLNLILRSEVSKPVGIEYGEYHRLIADEARSLIHGMAVATLDLEI